MWFIAKYTYNYLDSDMKSYTTIGVVSSFC